MTKKYLIPDRESRGAPSGICAGCETWMDKLELDHRTALCLGGPNTTDNLQWLCPSCHRKKTTKDIKQLKKIQKAHYRETMRILRERQA